MDKVALPQQHEVFYSPQSLLDRLLYLLLLQYYLALQGHSRQDQLELFRQLQI